MVFFMRNYTAKHENTNGYKIAKFTYLPFFFKSAFDVAALLHSESVSFADKFFPFVKEYIHDDKKRVFADSRFQFRNEFSKRWTVNLIFNNSTR